MTSHAALFAAVAVTAGCQIEGELTTGGAPLAAKIAGAQARMHERFEAARRIERAIGHSDLDSAKLEARKLTSLDEPDILPQWRPFLDRISASAGKVERAPDVVAAARATASLGRECARCHEATAAKITFAVEPRPPTNSRVPAQMLGHAWAAAQMWEGLIGPSDARWLDGAQALTQVALTIVAEEPTPVALEQSPLNDGHDIAGDIARVRLYANRAVAPRDWNARTEIFSDLLATCAHCHAVIRDR